MKKDLSYVLLTISYFQNDYVNLMKVTYLFTFDLLNWLTQVD